MDGRRDPYIIIYWWEKNYYYYLYTHTRAIIIKINSQFIFDGAFSIFFSAILLLLLLPSSVVKLVFSCVPLCHIEREKIIFTVVAAKQKEIRFTGSRHRAVLMLILN